MKCITLAKNLKAKKIEDVAESLETRPAKSFIEGRVVEVERGTAYTKLLNNLQGVYSAQDFDRLTETVKDKEATLGSDDTISFKRDDGFFSSVLEAYNNHWNLRSSPDDWWYCIIRRVALAIDKNAQKPSVRHLFVDYKGKKTLQVKVPSDNIYDIDYGMFFDDMSKQITDNVKVPEYVSAVTADFSVTTAIQKIVSQITLMSSIQEFFSYECMTSCGIPAVEMVGTEEDWGKLQSKLKVLKNLLKPISTDIELTTEWWAQVKKVFKKLLATYKGKPDKGWWSRIVSTKPFTSGASNPYTGWITQFMIGNDRGDFPSGLVTVPLTITHPTDIQDTGTLAAGMVGFTLHEDSENGVPSVRPYQGWCLLLPENSPFRHN